MSMQQLLTQLVMESMRIIYFIVGVVEVKLDGMKCKREDGGIVSRRSRFDIID